MANLFGKSEPWHSFIGGVIGSFFLLYFKTDMSINRQVGYYLVSRVLEAFFLLGIKKGYFPDGTYFYTTYTLIWGVVMCLFELDGSILNKSLKSSMDFLYRDSDRPITNPRFLQVANKLNF